MGVKWGVAVVLLAILVGYKLSSNENQALPSWPMYSLGLLLERLILWLDQTITPPELWLLRTMTGFATSKAIYIACELEIADFLAKGPLSSLELAKLAGTDPARTERVMKFLAVHGVFQRTDPDIYSNTAASEFLRKDHPKSPRAYFIHLGNEMTNIFQKYLDSLYDSSVPPYRLAYSNCSSAWEIISSPKMRSNFDQAMIYFAATTLPPIVHDFPWSRFGNVTLVDVGGGTGHISAAILQANPSFKAVVFDMDQVIEGAIIYLSVAYPDVYPRISLVKGSFFDSVPAGGDVYILKNILHDWNDNEDVQILQSIAYALKASEHTQPASVLIIETIYDYPPVHPFVGFSDMVMYAAMGKERTLMEYEELLRKAGLKLINVHQTRSLLVIMEAVLA